MSKSIEYTGKTKLAEVCDLMAAGREIDALRIVAKWPRLGEESGVITPRLVSTPKPRLLPWPTPRPRRSG